MKLGIKLLSSAVTQRIYLHTLSFLMCNRHAVLVYTNGFVTRTPAPQYASSVKQ